MAIVIRDVLKDVPLPVLGLIGVGMMACDRDSPLPGWGAELLPYGLQLGREHWSVLPTAEGNALKVNRSVRGGAPDEWVFSFEELRSMRFEVG